MRVTLIAASLFALAACQAVPDAEDQMSENVSCIAPSLQASVGQPLSTLDPTRLPDPKRIIGPGMAVTMDYRPDRLNVEHTAQGIITRIYCG